MKKRRRNGPTCLYPYLVQDTVEYEVTTDLLGVVPYISLITPVSRPTVTQCTCTSTSGDSVHPISSPLLSTSVSPVLLRVIVSTDPTF